MTGGSVMELVVGQARTGGGATGQIVAWVLVLIVLAIAGYFAAVWIRRRLMSDDAAASGAGLIRELEAQLARGEITREEFDAAKRLIVGEAVRALPNRAGGGAARGAPGTSGTSGMDGRKGGSERRNPRSG
jgi:uncharacterized membrane protein